MKLVKFENQTQVIQEMRDEGYDLTEAEKELNLTTVIEENFTLYTDADEDFFALYDEWGDRVEIEEIFEIVEKERILSKVYKNKSELECDYIYKNAKFIDTGYYKDTPTTIVPWDGWKYENKYFLTTIEGAFEMDKELWEEFWDWV